MKMNANNVTKSMNIAKFKNKNKIENWIVIERELQVERLKPKRGHKWSMTRTSAFVNPKYNVRSLEICHISAIMIGCPHCDEISDYHSSRNKISGAFDKTTDCLSPLSIRQRDRNLMKRDWERKCQWSRGMTTRHCGDRRQMHSRSRNLPGL